MEGSTMLLRKWMQLRPPYLQVKEEYSKLLDDRYSAACEVMEFDEVTVTNVEDLRALGELVRSFSYAGTARISKDVDEATRAQILDLAAQLSVGIAGDEAN